MKVEIAKTRRVARERMPRQDGDATRQHILETAGPLYAERGYALVTSKEICTRAGVNMASVNYHFGGKDGLYEAVLIEAHRQILSLEELERLAHAGDDPRARLRAVLARLLAMSARPETSWGLKVILREMMMPSPLLPALVRRAILPKSQVVRELIRQIMGLPPDHPLVQRGMLFSMLPSFVLLLAPREVVGKLFPDPSTAAPASLADDLTRFVLAGLEGMRGDPAQGDLAP
ncbi:MAG: CerR family C-terminal domain-containing protein [Candidatus Competibacteraceae bacterium]|nr:CerR family C-terminal domain-containing protein [Candidatus Competibacteraceae bacterium]MBK8964281.1 CerR family C-terminal domain-containing protein [Candidatus Competibacteraceae bacterium]MBK9950352.1 CerR family C-terminal domain-containing protein [Candidatus Competibacteraceae bacterium]